MDLTKLFIAKSRYTGNIDLWLSLLHNYKLKII